jgi:ribosomal protein L7Ae-like RNA K-turn-binding protein
VVLLIVSRRIAVDVSKKALGAWLGIGFAIPDDVVSKKALGAWLGVGFAVHDDVVSKKALGALAPAERDILVRFAHSNRARSAPLR